MANQANLENQQFAVLPFDEVKIRNGEDATPNNINRALVATLEGDVKLSEAMAFTDRSIALTCTPNTLLIANFIDSLDTKINAATFTTTGDTKFAVRNPYQYRGAFWSFKATANLINTMANTDSSLMSLNGWSTGGNTIGRCTFRAEQEGLRIRNYIRGGSSAAGDTTVVTTNFIDVTGLTQRYVSCGLTLQPMSPFEANGVSFAFGFEEYDSTNLLIKTTTIMIDKVSVNTMPRLENQAFHTDTVKIRPVFKLHFNEAGACIDLRVKDFCIYNMPYIGGYSDTNSNGCSVSYTNVFDTHDSTQSVISRVNLNESYILNMGAETANVLTLQQEITGDLLSIVITNGKLRFRYTDHEFNVIEETPEYTLKAADLGYFSIAGIRYGDRLEAYFVDGNGEVHIFLLSDHLALHNARFNVVLGNFHDSFVPLNSPITDLRIDKEWFNDEQIKVVYLSTQPFADYKETALTSTDIRDIIDGVNVNLLPNPDGRLFLNHWTNFPLNSGIPDETKFTNLHNDPFIGTGFIWKGGAAQTVKEIFSEFISIKNDDYTLLRGKVDSISGTVGVFGLGVSFYRSALATDKIGNTEYVYAEPGTALRYYALKLVTPLEATHARVSMFIGPDVVSNRITWSRMKLEQGSDFTVFEDSGSRKYALYAPVNSTVIIGAPTGGGTSGGSGTVGVPTHYHVKADILDFAHKHYKTDILDFAHSHAKAEITDFTHRHVVGDIDGSLSATANVTVLTGIALHGALLPLPDGFTEAQCKWSISTARPGTFGNPASICYTSNTFVPWADLAGASYPQLDNFGNYGRYVNAYGGGGPDYVNYIVIGVK